MAGDWIKMRTDLYRDPKVCVIADALLSGDSLLARYVSQNNRCEMSVTRNVMRNVTVGALVSVWGVLRHRGKRVGDDLIVARCSVSVVDDVADIPGFGDAMASVGWIEENDGCIVFPRFFEEFNVDPSEEMKAKNAERQRRHREKLKAESNVTRDVTVASQSNAREEKSREEIKNKESPPPDGGPVWTECLQVLRDQNISEKQSRSFLGLLCREYEEKVIVDAVKASIGKANVTAYIRGVLRSQPKKGANRLQVAV